eukprot:GFKZ01009264.1.p2 GENE.GFKZ01009264.1~~GFKZ01009264.1.p2  ORF type:complete len:109 (-),score=10.82 GFKZ01009264.1:603-929(-)
MPGQVCALDTANPRTWKEGRVDGGWLQLIAVATLVLGDDLETGKARLRVEIFIDFGRKDVTQRRRIAVLSRTRFDRGDARWEACGGVSKVFSIADLMSSGWYSTCKTG